MFAVRLSYQGKSLAWSGVLFATLLGVSDFASAQQPTQAQASAIRQSCAADYRAHCASVPTGGAAALACLQQNAASVSPSCQRELAAVGGGAAPGQTQTGQTPANPPAGPPAGPSSAPAAAAPVTPPPLTPRQQALVLRRACAPDYQRLCHGVAPGGGRAIACLDENASALSPGCRNTLASMRQGR